MSDQCPVGVRNGTRIDQLRIDHDHLVEVTKDNKNELWTAIDELKQAMTYRLPLYAVGIFGILCSAITLLATLYVHKL